MIASLNSKNLSLQFCSQQHTAFPTRNLTVKQTLNLINAIEQPKGKANALGLQLNFVPDKDNKQNTQRAQLVTTHYLHDLPSALQLADKLKSITGVSWQATASRREMFAIGGQGTYNLTPIPQTASTSLSRVNITA